MGEGNERGVKLKGQDGKKSKGEEGQEKGKGKQRFSSLRGINRVTPLMVGLCDKSKSLSVLKLY